MALRTVAALLLAFAAAGCAYQAVNEREIAIGRVDLRANSPELRSEVERQLAQLTVTGSMRSTLTFNEDRTERIAAFAGSGQAAKRELLYVMRYTVEQPGHPVIEGEYRYSQTLDNDERFHRANLRENRHFFDQARADGVTSMLADLSYQISARHE